MVILFWVQVCKCSCYSWGEDAGHFVRVLIVLCNVPVVPVVKVLVIVLWMQVVLYNMSVSPRVECSANSFRGTGSLVSFLSSAVVII